jgi:hypothetical protein
MIPIAIKWHNFPALQLDRQEEDSSWKSWTNNSYATMLSFFSQFSRNSGFASGFSRQLSRITTLPFF